MKASIVALITVLLMSGCSVRDSVLSKSITAAENMCRDHGGILSVEGGWQDSYTVGVCNDGVWFSGPSEEVGGMK